MPSQHCWAWRVLACAWSRAWGLCAAHQHTRLVWAGGFRVFRAVPGSQPSCCSSRSHSTQASSPHSPCAVPKPVFPCCCYKPSSAHACIHASHARNRHTQGRHPYLPGLRLMGVGVAAGEAAAAGAAAAGDAAATGVAAAAAFLLPGLRPVWCARHHATRCCLSAHAVGLPGGMLPANTLMLAFPVMWSTTHLACASLLLVWRLLLLLLGSCSCCLACGLQCWNGHRHTHIQACHMQPADS